MGFGLLVLRVVVGALFIGHGTQKLFGWFGGPGPEGTSDYLESLDYRRPDLLSRIAGGTETTAGALLLLGLFTPFAAAAVLGMMLNAIGSVHLKNGFWNSEGGYEFPLVLAAAAVLFGFAGPGALAIDTGLGIFVGGGWELVTIALGLAVGFAVLAMRDTEHGVTIDTGDESAEYARDRAA